MSCAVNNVGECAIYARGERLSTGYTKVPARRPLSWRRSSDPFGYHPTTIQSFCIHGA